MDAMADAEGCSPCDGGADAMSPSADCGAPEAAGPSLSSLSVTGATLVPPFSPGVHDYYVACGAAVNDVKVSLKASSGTTTSLSLETPASPTGTRKTVGSTAEQQAVSLSLGENQAVVATATEGKSSQEYWVRCLPPGFPPVLDWKTYANGCSRTPGYYLIGTMSQGSPGWPIVFDTNGVPVWYSPSYAGGNLYDVETLVDGGISFYVNGWQVHQIGGATTYPVADSYEGGTPESPDEHELRILPNGHYVGLSADGEPGVNLTGLTVPESDGGVFAFGPNTTIYACYVREFDPKTGAIYWDWSATDHFNPVTAMVLKGDGDLTDAEPFHCNAIDVDPVTGNLLVSARNMNSVFYIDKSTKKVLWKMGGSDCSVSDAGVKSCLDDPPPVYVPVKDPFRGQHDARLHDWKETCSGGSGTISVFDDESYTSNPARGAAYKVVVNNGSGCVGGTTGTTGATLAWEYKTWKKVPSGVTGSFRINEDGSRIMGWGQSDPAPNGLVFTEVDVDGNDLLDLISSNDSSTYRAIKVPLSAFDLNLLRSTSGQ